nr:MAG TPA: hypothetical protein [Caudoviricetes sp.]
MLLFLIFFKYSLVLSKISLIKTVFYSISFNLYLLAEITERKEMS